MIVRARSVGSGRDGDPVRVPFPTYRLLAQDYAARIATILIPEDVHGFTPEALAHEPVQPTPDGLAYPQLCAACVAAIMDRLADRYPQHRGEYHLEVIRGVF